LVSASLYLQPFHKLWNMINDFHISRKEWLLGPFLELNGPQIENEVTEWWKTSYRFAKLMEEQFPGAAGCAMRLREETTEFRQHLPVIQSLASPALKPRHWESLSERIGKEIEPDEELTLKGLLDMDIGAYIEVIQEVCVAAKKEYDLETALNNMKAEWAAVQYEVMPYRNTGTFVISGVDDIISLLDDHLAKTQTMRTSPFIKPIEAVCRDWEFRLKYAQGLLDEWIKCQRTWMYLEPIFGSEDIMRQLPTEARRFNAVDQLWRKTMADTNQDPAFMVQCDPDKKLRDKFAAANQKLDEIQKGLTDYLEMKRLYFPRFFFLSNDELLEILSQTKEPRAVQPHLNKAFEGINKVKFEKDLKITEMISAQGETVKLNYHVDPESGANKGNVEKWLLELEKDQWESIRTQTEKALAEYPTMNRTQWTLRWPAQVVLAVSQVYWTQDVVRHVRSGGSAALGVFVEELNAQLKEIVKLVRGKLSRLDRSTLGALVVIDVHARDVVQKMVDVKVESETDFEWVSQLRYYWEASWKDGQAVKAGDKTMVARIVNAKCLYGYEYLGNTVRLVITPLTDRCYRTMIGAIDLLYGGAPEGPAGTGKTETVKDLSKVRALLACCDAQSPLGHWLRLCGVCVSPQAVAIQCVVFNCSDGLDYLAMAKFFKGLAGCGSWCCFDEFNRINIEVCAWLVCLARVNEVSS
jgi:dynein heavy chain